jgi:hypothetical protein
MNHNPPTGASEEVIHHHLRLHAQHCPMAGPRRTVCACGRTVTFVCESCGCPLFHVLDRGTFCTHAAEMTGRQR